MSQVSINQLANTATSLDDGDYLIIDEDMGSSVYQTKKLAGSKIVRTEGNQTIAGTKTFSSTISGSVSGNSGTVTNGVYTTGDQTIAGIKTMSSKIKTTTSGVVFSAIGGGYGSTNTIQHVMAGGIGDTGYNNAAVIEVARLSAYGNGVDMRFGYAPATAADSVGTFTNLLSLSTVNGVASSGIYNKTSASAANVYIDGSGILYRSTSSIQYKDDIKEGVDSSKIYNLIPVTYHSKGDESDKRHLGFIAEEVVKIEPMLVHFDNDNNPIGVQYERLTVLLVEEIKNLRKELDELKMKIIDNKAIDMA